MNIGLSVMLVLHKLQSKYMANNSVLAKIWSRTVHSASFGVLAEPKCNTRNCKVHKHCRQSLAWLSLGINGHCNYEASVIPVIMPQRYVFVWQGWPLRFC